MWPGWELLPPATATPTATAVTQTPTPASKSDDNSTGSPTSIPFAPPARPLSPPTSTPTTSPTAAAVSFGVVSLSVELRDPIMSTTEFTDGDDEHIATLVFTVFGRSFRSEPVRLPQPDSAQEAHLWKDWSHVIATSDADGTMSIYLNGNLLAEGMDSSDTDVAGSTGNDIEKGEETVGQAGVSGQSWNAKVFRMEPRLLAGATIAMPATMGATAGMCCI